MVLSLLNCLCTYAHIHVYTHGRINKIANIKQLTKEENCLTKKQIQICIKLFVLSTLCVSVCVCVCVCTCVGVSVCVYVCVYVCVFLSVCASMCVCVSVCVCLC